MTTSVLNLEMHKLIGRLLKGFAMPRRTMMPMMEPFFCCFFYGTVKTTCCHAVIAEQERRPMLEKQAGDPGTSSHKWKNFDWKHCCLRLLKSVTVLRPANRPGKQLQHRTDVQNIQTSNLAN